MTRQRFLRFDCLHSLKFPSCSLPRLDTSVNFTRKHRRASPCAELSVVSDYNRLLTQYVHPKIVYIRVFFGGGSGFFFFFCTYCVKTLRPLQSLMYVLVRIFVILAWWYIEVFFLQNKFYIKDIALFHSPLSLFFCFETKCRRFINVF